MERIGEAENLTDRGGPAVPTGYSRKGESRTSCVGDDLEVGLSSSYAGKKISVEVVVCETVDGDGSVSEPTPPPFGVTRHVGGFN